MDIRSILEKKKFEVSDKPTRINTKWEQAKEFCQYLGFGDDKKMIVFVLMLNKRYGEGKVFGLRSWLKDANYRRAEVQGLMVWRLKGGKNV